MVGEGVVEVGGVDVELEVEGGWRGVEDVGVFGEEVSGWWGGEGE